MPSNTVAIREGRLIEIRVDAGYRDEGEVDQIFQALADAVRGRSPGRKFVSVADWRRCPLLEERAAERLAQKMEGNNPLVERSAALIPLGSPVVTLQFTRLIRESNNANRRMFTQAAPLIAWLSEILTPEEQRRLREFLGEA